MQPDETDLKQLLADLNCRLQPVRETAVARVRTLSREQVKALSVLEDKSRKYSQYEDAINSGTFLLFSALIGGGIALYTSSIIGGLISFGLLVGAFINFGKSEKPFARDFLHRHLLEIWEPSNILEALQVMYEYATTENHDESVSLRSKTSRLFIKEYLLREKEFPFDTLSNKHATAVRWLLRSPYADTDRTLLLLRAMEKIGDEKMLDMVTWLAKEPRATPNMIAVSDAARVTRRKIKERVAKLQLGKTLLRASSNPESSSSDVLLRPAASSLDTTPPEQLLRPIASDES